MGLPVPPHVYRRPPAESNTGSHAASDDSHEQKLAPEQVWPQSQSPLSPHSQRPRNEPAPSEQVCPPAHVVAQDPQCCASVWMFTSQALSSLPSQLAVALEQVEMLHAVASAPEFPAHV